MNIKLVSLVVIGTLAATVSISANPATKYKETYSTTSHGVQFGIGLPSDFSTAKKYFLCLSLSGAGPITHRLWSIGELFGYGEEAGFEPIYCSIDYGTEWFVNESSANKTTLVNRFQQALTDIKALYPNVTQIMGTSFCEGSSFITYYNVLATTENRIVALAPSSSGNIGVPTNRNKNYVKFRFTCGSTDGNIDGIIKALPTYTSFGYSASLYVEQGQTHQVGEPSKREIAKFFKAVSDSILKIPSAVQVPRIASTTATMNTSIGNDFRYMITGRLLPGNATPVPAMIIQTGDTRKGRSAVMFR